VCLTEFFTLAIVCLGLLVVFLWSLKDRTKDVGYPEEQDSMVKNETSNQVNC
jgi:hypothetical protein